MLVPLNLCARFIAPITASSSPSSLLRLKRVMQQPCVNDIERCNFFRSISYYCRHDLPVCPSMQLFRNSRCGYYYNSSGSPRCSSDITTSRWLQQPIARRCSSASGGSSSQSQQRVVIEGAAVVEYNHGLPVLTLPLASRGGERCEFALRPVTETVADLCGHVRREDNSLTTVGIYTTNGAKIAGSTSIEHLMQSDFHIRLDDQIYVVRPPKRPSLTTEHVQQLEDVKTLVASLHATLNTDEQFLRNERELLAKIEVVKQALEPLETQKTLVTAESERRTSRLLWFGLGLMGVQLGAFAQLTWFVYSWDIMEPVTYFATYTAVIGGYAYFVATRIQYEYPDAKERAALNKFYNICRKKGFDVEKYNRLREDIYELQNDLDRLRRSPNFPSSFRGVQSSVGDNVILVVRESADQQDSSGTIHRKPEQITIGSQITTDSPSETRKND